MGRIVRKCKDCGVELEEGFVVHTSHTRTTAEVSYWVEGEPEFGLFGGLKERSKRKFYVKQFRCPRCGKLEPYAM